MTKRDKSVFEELAKAKKLPRGKGLTYNPMASLSDGTSFELGYIGKIEPLGLLDDPDYKAKDE